MTLGQILADFLRHELFSLGSLPRSKAVASLSIKAQIHGADKDSAIELAIEVIDALHLAGDIGLWTSFGEPMILLLKRRTIALEAKTVLLLGGAPSDGETFGLLRRTAAEVEFNCEPANFDRRLSKVDKLPVDLMLEQGTWTTSVATSPELKKVLVRLGCEPGRRLTYIAREHLKDLSDVLGPISSHNALDASQLQVVLQDQHARLVVTAGPGSGKTHTASARVIELVKAGVSPASIHLITFTRVAAQEISRRVSAALADQVYGAGIQCFTLDALAWQIVNTFEDYATSGGYDQFIRRARDLLSAGDARMADWIGRLGHLVIDEAQDVVGIRQEFCTKLVAALPSSVGVTVFGDWAQAIYGVWSDRDNANSSSSSNLHSHFAASDEWQKLELNFNHRAKSPEIKFFTMEARATLGDASKSPRDRYLSVRAMIENAASSQDADLLDPRVPWNFDNLILSRSRMGAEAASTRLARHGRPHRLKLSGHTHVIEPLIGALCNGMTAGETMTPVEVEQRMAALSPPAYGWTAEGAFALLKTVAGTGKAAPKLNNILLGVERSPIHISQDYIGQSGPLVGSIHGAKGKEAEDVFLLMPPIPDHLNVDWDEEARVLFVAASRASKRLHLGRSRTVAGKVRPDGSRWISGLDGGLALSGSDGLSPLPGREAADAVWAATFDQPLCTFRRHKTEAEWCLVLQNGTAISSVTPQLSENLDYLANGAHSLPFGSLRVAGSTTATITRKDGKAIGVSLLPILQGTVRSSFSAYNRGAA
jgi:DNA helicase-2/ATP-dependent DNA helicase PcrA